jgi:hypothetical protein
MPRPLEMDEAEKTALIEMLAANPKAGDLMVGTGGARKLRFARPGTGKSGGYRIVTYYAGTDALLFLLNVFTKNDRANLSQSERNELRDILADMASFYRKGPRL